MGLFFIIQVSFVKWIRILSTDIENKISEDLSPTRNLTGLHLKVVADYSNHLDFISALVCLTHFLLWFDIGMFKGLPARAIHLGFALTLLAFLIFPISKSKKISIIDVIN